MSPNESERAAPDAAPEPASRNDADEPAASAAHDDPAAAAVPPDQPWAPATLQGLRADLQRFAAERDWGQFHTPRNLLLALVGEVGELAECFQWRGEVAAGLPGFSAEERRHVGEELSDCLLYLLRLADACGVDLAAAAAAKMQKNAAKYPAEACRGSAAKYTRYVAAQQRGEPAQQREQEAQQQPAGLWQAEGAT